MDPPATRNDGALTQHSLRGDSLLQFGIGVPELAFLTSRRYSSAAAVRPAKRSHYTDWSNTVELDGGDGSWRSGAARVSLSGSDPAWALDVFHDAARRVPAYADFLARYPHESGRAALEIAGERRLDRRPPHRFAQERLDLRVHVASLHRVAPVAEHLQWGLFCCPVTRLRCRPASARGSRPRSQGVAAQSRRFFTDMLASMTPRRPATPRNREPLRCEKQANHPHQMNVGNLQNPSPWNPGWLIRYVAQF